AKRAGRARRRGGAAGCRDIGGRGRPWQGRADFRRARHRQEGGGDRRLRQAAVAPTRVVSGAAEELEMRIPFAAIADCLGLTGGSVDREVAGIAALLRGAGRGGSGTALLDGTEFLVTEAILAMLDGWCGVGPVVLALDDLQWADPASLLV